MVKSNLKKLDLIFQKVISNSAFTYCLGVDTNQSITNMDSHMMKNNEWGAAAYFTQAVGTVPPNRNDNSSIYTGGSSTVSTVYTNATNLGQSTTGTAYGIYDMSGGAWDYVAAYLNNGAANLTTNGNSLYTAADKYKDVFPSGGFTDSANMLGMAMNETSGWNSDGALMPTGGSVFFERGGYYDSWSAAGIYAYSYNPGNTDMARCGFRVVITSP